MGERLSINNVSAEGVIGTTGWQDTKLDGALRLRT